MDYTQGWHRPESCRSDSYGFWKRIIRAEVINYEDFITYDGDQGSKEAGKMRLEGKEYVVKDGDVMNFRFNV